MNLFGIAAIILGIIYELVPLAIGVAVLYFLWGCLKYVKASDGETQGEAKNMITHGIIILFVMVSVWGLVNLIGETFQIGPLNLRSETVNVGGGLGGGTTSSKRIFCYGQGC